MFTKNEAANLYFHFPITGAKKNEGGYFQLKITQCKNDFQNYI
jgi:hypothetical protein